MAKLPDTLSEVDLAILEADEKIIFQDEKKLYEDDFAVFAKRAWKEIEPGREVIWSWHLDLLCRFLGDFRRRKFRNGIINIPFRLSKSMLVSVLYPAWVWCQTTKIATHGGPGHQFLTLSHREDLAIRDALKTRTLIESPWYKSYWPNVRLAGDQSEKKRYHLEGQGYRVAQGITAGTTGESADTIIIDDPHDAEKALSEALRLQVNESYDLKIISRLNDHQRGGKLIIMQRVHGDDLVSHVIKRDGLYSKKNPGGWMQVVLPMEYELDERDKPVNPAGAFGYRDIRAKAGDLLCPQRLPRQSVEELKASLGEFGASGQLQQRPSPKGGMILRKNWWRLWPDSRLAPKCDHIFVSWDTAYTAEDRKTNSFSAYTVWGVFYHEEERRHCVMLLERWYGQIDYDELRRKVREITNRLHPNAHLVEAKASGQSLIQDMRRIRPTWGNLLVRSYQPDRDKIARAYAVQAMLQSGQIYYPDRKWAAEVIDIIGQFPAGAPPCSDITDTATQAWLYLRNGWWVSHPDDDKPTDTGQSYDEDYEPKPRRAAYG